jgi:hypothetical protein
MKIDLTLSDVKALMKQIAFVDNREIRPEIVSAWYDILVSIPTEETVTLDDLLEALKMCRADTGINWVEPRHIIAKTKIILAKRIEAREHEQRVADREWKGVPCPECEHDKLIINCMPCARKLN